MKSQSMLKCFDFFSSSWKILVTAPMKCFVFFALLFDVTFPALIWCIVGCCVPSDDFFAEKYGTKIMREEMLINPKLCFVHNLF
jgi:hypothetical protein